MPLLNGIPNGRSRIPRDSAPGRRVRPGLWAVQSSGEGSVTVRGCTSVSSSSPPVTIFWRPGCPYCWRLRSKVRRAGVHVEEVNIWEDPTGAAFVRSITGGDETVPTVRIGTQSFVNPSPRRILEMIREAHC